jgi:hypothetical protein
MGDLSERDVEDVLGGVQPPSRDDLAPVVELTTWLHVSREIEPPPAMRDDLFCQIEDGLRVYQRSSRRAPAHLRHRRTSTRRVRETLAGSGRPIVSVAAAAVLLIGVILAVRAGGPAREPSAFVSPAAQGLPGTGADATTTTTTAPTTTSPPTSASDPAAPADAGSTVGDSEQSTTAEGMTESPASTDMPTAGPRSRDDDATPPTTERRDNGATPEPDGAEPGGRMQPPRSSDATDDTGPWTLPLSGWDFDLSDWPEAKALWAALQAEERGEPRDLRDDPDSDSDSDSDSDRDSDRDRDRDSDSDRDRDRDSDGGQRNHRRFEVGGGERDGAEDGATDRPDVGDAERDPRSSD